ncbi:hypothetical protein OK016_28665 [Vibrio chagasii]|nr:hypothetical protein [Vibrio chagasii]
MSAMRASVTVKPLFCRQPGASADLGLDKGDIRLIGTLLLSFLAVCRNLSLSATISIVQTSLPWLINATGWINIAFGFLFARGFHFALVLNAEPYGRPPWFGLLTTWYSRSERRLVTAWNMLLQRW